MGSESVYLQTTENATVPDDYNGTSEVDAWNGYQFERGMAIVGNGI